MELLEKGIRSKGQLLIYSIQILFKKRKKKQLDKVILMKQTKHFSVTLCFLNKYELN